jgi:S1-C subfamily serine protease
MNSTYRERSNWRDWLLVVVGAALLALAIWAADRLISPPLRHASDDRAIDEVLGATVEPLDPATARELGDGRGPDDVVVTSLASGGPAERAGIRSGDVIEAVNGKAPGTARELAPAAKRSPVTVIINRHGNHVMVTLPTTPPSGAAKQG